MQTLKALLDTMIPPSSDYSVPGAGDEFILVRVVQSIRAAATQSIIEGLGEVAQLAIATTGQTLAALEPAIREKWFHEQSIANLDFVRPLGTMALHCYYTDERVMKSLGMEYRPPFPKGFEVEQGDWDLLEPVKARDKLYREV